MAPGEVSINDVCAGAVPREAQGTGFEWSPDGIAIAYFQPLPSGFGLRLELDLVSADGTKRETLLGQEEIDKLFPPRPSGEEGLRVPPPRAKVGFAWVADGSALLLHSDLSIALVDRKTHETRPLVSGKEAIDDVQLSPDGRSVAFVRDHNLWSVPLAGGTAHAITRGGAALLHKGELDWLYPAELGTKHGYAWSPDSSRIAYFEFNLKGVPAYTPPFADDEDPAQTIDYPTPGAHNPVVHVFVAGTDGKTAPTLIDTGAEKDVYLPRLQWLPTGKQIAVQRLNRAQNRLDLLFADARTGRSRVALTESDDYWINLTDTLYFLKSAPQFIWASERSGYRHLYLYSLEGKQLSQLTGGKWEVTSLDAVDEANRKFFYTSTEKSDLERTLYAASLDGKTKVRISSDSGTHEATFAPGAALYVDNFSTAVKPWVRSVYKVNIQAGEAVPESRSSSVKLFALNTPAKSDSPVQETRNSVARPVDLISVKTHDGVDMNALLLRPAGFAPGKKYPAILYVHGGPGHQAVRDAWDGQLSLFRQYLAQHGFIVFAVDNRGTSGRGHAFEEYIHLRFEAQEMTDQRDAVHFLQSLPYVDANRLGIWGQDFGAALTINAMLHPPLLFKAGFAVAPIVNWQHYDSAFTERYLGDPVKNQDGYLSSSPLDEWQRYKGPMLAAQGSSDLFVHPDQLMELQEDLTGKRKYLEMGLFSDQPHSIDDPNACAVLYQRASDFFAQNLLN
jgi:dipeptidyl-peptidase-4